MTACQLLSISDVNIGNVILKVIVCSVTKIPTKLTTCHCMLNIILHYRQKFSGLFLAAIVVVKLAVQILL